MNKIEKKTLFTLLVSGLLILSLSIIGSIGKNEAQARQIGTQENKITFRVATPPDPNSIPLIILKNYEDSWLIKDGHRVNVEIVLAPGGDPSAMKALLHGRQVDFALFNNLGAAKFYSMGERHLKLLGVHVWRGIYILTWQNITEWKQLNNLKGIAVPAIKTPPHIWAVKALKMHGIKVQFASIGMGQALFTTLSRPEKSVPIVVAPEPAVTMILMKQEMNNWKVKYKVFADTAKEINPVKGVPLGAMVLVKRDILQQKDKRKAMDILIEGFKRAIAEVNDREKIAQNSRVLVRGWKTIFHQWVPERLFEMMLRSGRLGLNFRSSNKIKGDLVKLYSQFGIKSEKDFFLP